MDLESDAKLCRFRIYEAEYGYIDARLTLRATEDGGRRTPIFTDYRPSWNIGNRAEDDTVEINDARVSLEDCQSLLPGHTGTVRLHPLLPDEWRRVREGDNLDMHEGARIVGRAVVLRVSLRGAA